MPITIKPVFNPLLIAECSYQKLKILLDILMYARGLRTQYRAFGEIKQRVAVHKAVVVKFNPFTHTLHAIL